MPDEQLYYLGQKALIRNADGDVLVLRISKKNRIYYDLPGGRVNSGEGLADALRREVLEETGISQLKVLRLLGVAPTGIRIPVTTETEGGLVLAVYTCEAALPDQFSPEDNMEVLWCEPTDTLKKLGDYPSELTAVISKEFAAEY